MASDVVMPRLSDSMEEGTILKWLVSEGDEVKRGQEIVEIEADKANMTYEADTDGVIVEIVAEEGQTLPLGEVICRIGEPGESPQPSGPSPQEEEPEPEREPASATAETATKEREPEPSAAPPAGDGDGRVKASPVARRMARDLEGEAEVWELSRLQQTVSRRMAESKATAPDFALQIDVDMTRAVELRERLKEVSEPAPSFNDMVLKAAATALREHPRVNGAYRDGKWELYSRVNLGMAVAAEETLVVPTIFDADQKSLGEISRTARALIDKVRESKTP